MNSTNSFLLTLLERIRAYLDEPDLDAKYSNDWLLRHIVTPSLVDVISRLNNTIRCPVILIYPITIVSGQTRYPLPPSIAEVVRVVTLDTNGQIISDSIPRDRMHPLGPGWSLEGSSGCLELVIDALRLGTDNATLQLQYISNGDFLPHYGTSGALTTTANTSSTLVLQATPTYGALDRRESAYNGGVLRLLPAAPGVVEERLIRSYSESAGSWSVTTDRPFTKVTTGSGLLYEIVPAACQSFAECTACRSAIKLGTARRLTQEHMKRLETEYRMALKTIGDNLTNMQTRSPTKYEKNTVDNEQTMYNWGQVGYR